MNGRKQNKESLIIMSSGKLKPLFALVALVMIAMGGYLVYLYQKGSAAHFQPPVIKATSPKAQVFGDLTTLSQAIEAYHSKNLRYPEKLTQLQPEFLDKIPLDSKAGKSFLYESDGINWYRIAVSDPTIYELKELIIENGKIIQK